MSQAADPHDPQSALWRLLYVSRVPAETAARLDLVMLDILTVSRNANALAGLTGLLYSDGRWFTQVLEGARSEVEALYERIAVDRRHVDPVVRRRGPIPRREFDRWSMCGLTLSDLDDALTDLPASGAEFAAWEPDDLIDMLSRLSETFGDQLDQRHAELARRDLRGADR